MNLATSSSRAFAFVLLLALPAGHRTNPNDEPEVYDDPAGYAVLSKLLEPREQTPKDFVLEIASPTVSAKEMWRKLGDCVQVPDEFEAAARDFEQKIAVRRELEDRFQLRVKHAIVKPRPATAEDYAKLRAAGPASAPRASSLYYVSAVGFDSDKTHAIVYVNVLCGINCCGGTFHLLKKGAQGWEEVKDVVKCKWMC